MPQDEGPLIELKARTTSRFELLKYFFKLLTSILLSYRNFCVLFIIFGRWILIQVARFQYVVGT